MLERQQQVQRQRQRQRRRRPRPGNQAAGNRRAVARQAWLTRLEYQRDTLMLSGLALNLKPWQLEKALNAVAGFAPAKPVKRAATPGALAVSLFLSGEHADAGTH
jgi:pilus assembly protein HofN